MFKKLTIVALLATSATAAAGTIPCPVALTCYENTKKCYGIPPGWKKVAITTNYDYRHNATHSDAPALIRWTRNMGGLNTLLCRYNNSSDTGPRVDISVQTSNEPDMSGVTLYWKWTSADKLVDECNTDNMAYKSQAYCPMKY